MKLRWVVPVLFVLCMSSGCMQGNLSKAPQSDPRISRQFKVQTTSVTPDLVDGPEKKVRTPHSLSLADLRMKYRSSFYLNGPTTKREVALTFDDAPDAVFTPQVLDVLASEGVRATFFVVGNRAKKHPEIIKRMVDDGHVVGNHSYTHANLPKLADDQFRDQIIRTDQLIRQYTGYAPDFVRPPYGNISEGQIQWLVSQNKKIVNWNVDSLDWKGLDAEEVKTNVLAHVRPGSIILQHAAGGAGEDLSGTVQALPDIIRILRSEGIRFVTIPELLRR